MSSARQLSQAYEDAAEADDQISARNECETTTLSVLLDQGEQALNAAYVRVEQLERDKAELLLLLLDARAAGASQQQEAREEVPQFTCFTGAKVQILTLLV